MKKNILGLVVALCCIISSNAQFLKAKGTQIVNDKGEPVIFRGVGLGGWMLQEGYMFHFYNVGPQYRIKEKITELVGPEKTKQFYDRWLKNHTTKRDIDSLAAWGFNAIRLPMHYNLFTLPVDEEPVKGQQTWLPRGFAMTDSLLRWCSSNHMYLILDLHATPGGQGNDLPISDRNADKPSLWESEANREKMVALWKKLAEHYANEPWIGGYDIINEPNWGFEDPVKDKRGTAETKNEPLKALMMSITQAIRTADKKHIVIIEGNAFGNNYLGIMPPWDDNMALSFHKYGNFNTTDAIQRFLTLRETWHVPIWMGESGENSNTWFTDAISLAESNGIGWTWWPMKKMGINNPFEIKKPKDYDKLLGYWLNKGPKPSEAEAWGILQNMLENLKVENNIVHADVIDAMFRQVRSTETRPFKDIYIDNGTTVQAVDFDLGRQRYAYFDRDSASYPYTPGVHSDGNRGHAYRNDGADIQNSDQGPYIFNTEDGEWMQYTVQVKEAGNYKVSFIVANNTDSGVLSLLNNGKPVVNELALPATGGMQNWKPCTVNNIALQKGLNRLRVLVVKGGFNFSGMRFEKQQGAAVAWNSQYVKIKKNGQLEYVPDAQGNTIPDFSGVGYMKNRTALPRIPVVKQVEPAGENDQQAIQAAIDEVAKRPIDKNGFRGAVLLKKGTYKIPGTLYIKASGIVIRGEGNETKLVATGKGQRSVIFASGNGALTEIPGFRKKIVDHYVPVGAQSFTVENTSGLKPGDSIIVFRPAVLKWIDDIKMNQINQRDSTIRQWDTAEYGLHYERVITRIEKNRIYIDNPVVMAMEDQYGGGAIYRYHFNGRITNIAVENLLCESEYNGDEDEDHGWDAIHFNKVMNGFITNVTARYFGYSCVNLGAQTRNVTVTNCQCLSPKSKIIGGRRYSFNNDGQLNLFMDCFASEGRHDYVTGAKVCGPNVFYNCRAEKTNADIGPHHRWATGTLYDNIVTDGEINAQDRGDWGTGHGWAGANQVFWNCTVQRAAIQNPWASAKNYVIGLQGNKYGGRLKGRPDAAWEGQNQAGLTPASLYAAQMNIARKDAETPGK